MLDPCSACTAFGRGDLYRAISAMTRDLGLHITLKTAPFTHLSQKLRGTEDRFQTQSNGDHLDLGIDKIFDENDSGQIKQYHNDEQKESTPSSNLRKFWGHLEIALIFKLIPQ